MDKCTVTVEVYSHVRTFPLGSVAQSLDISAGFSGFQSQPITVEKSAFWLKLVLDDIVTYGHLASDLNTICSLTNSEADGILARQVT